VKKDHVGEGYFVKLQSVKVQITGTKKDAEAPFLN
jgi:hypothetical protein